MRLVWKRLDGQTGHDAGRELLALAYRQETGQEMPEIAVTHRGKPYFPNDRLHFSISHTKSHAFCCLHDCPVGLDAEEADRQIDLRLAEKFLSPREKARFHAAADPRAALLRLWVLKEARAKYTGQGIGSYLRQTDFSPDDPRIREIDGCFVAILTE